MITYVMEARQSPIASLLNVLLMSKNNGGGKAKS
jgi:hypothetical protein